MKNEPIVTYNTFYHSWHDAMGDLSDSEYGKVCRTLNEYCFFGTIPELTGVAKILFVAFKANIDASTRNKLNGKKGGKTRSGGAPFGNSNAKKDPELEKNNSPLLNNQYPPIGKNNSKVKVKEKVNENVDESPGEEEQTTTNFLNIQETAKLQGFFLTDKQAQGFYCLDSTWLSGDFTFVEFAAEKIRDGPEKTHGDHERIFAKAWDYKNLLDEFPQWRKAKEAEAVAREERHRQETAAEEERCRIEEARKNSPKTCLLCSEPVTGDGSCPYCNYCYVFNEETGIWDFQKKINVAEEFHKLVAHLENREDIP